MFSPAFLTLCSSALLLVQTQAAAFEVASIRPSPGTEGRRIDVTPGTLVMRSVTLADLIQWAYSVESYQVQGPSWIADARFDVSAKPESPASENQHRVMLQALLADRFKLELHRETREMSVLVLNIAKDGHKLQCLKGNFPESPQALRRALSTSLSSSVVL